MIWLLLTEQQTDNDKYPRTKIILEIASFINLVNMWAFHLNQLYV